MGSFDTEFNRVLDENARHQTNDVNEGFLSNFARHHVIDKTNFADFWDRVVEDTGGLKDFRSYLTEVKETVHLYQEANGVRDDMPGFASDVKQFIVDLEKNDYRLPDHADAVSRPLTEFQTAYYQRKEAFCTFMGWAPFNLFLG